MYTVTKEELNSVPAVSKEFLKECKMVVDNYKKVDTITTDDVAALLVQLFADWCAYIDDKSKYKDYSRAVAIAIRMLTD